MDKNHFFELLGKKESGEISLAEHTELMRACHENPEYAAIAGFFNKLFELPASADSNLVASETEAKWEALNEKLFRGAPKKERFSRIFYLKWTVAACLILFVGLGVFLGLKNNDNSGGQNIVSTKKGSRSNLVLPDGTQVWLNADSRITYREGFDKNNREVNLEGEAYFDVVRDTKHPFVIHTRALDVKVLGTAFNVRAYANEKNTETTLVRGLVEIILKGNAGKKIVLKPNEKILVSNNYTSKDETVSQTVAKEEMPDLLIQRIKNLEKDSLSIETQWIKNRLAFDNQELKNVAMLLSRWYGVEVVVKNDALKGKRFSGIFEEGSLSQVLEALKLTGGFSYEIDKNNVLIY